MDWVIGLGLPGGLLGAGIGIGLLATPFVQIQCPEGQQGGQAPPTVPSCDQFIDEALVQPEDGRVFDLGTDSLFDLSPQPDPPSSQTRWRIEIDGPEATAGSHEFTGDASFPLSSLGLDPKLPCTYYWSLSAERLDQGANIWSPLCDEPLFRSFRIQEPQKPTATATSTTTITPTVDPTVTPTITPTASIPTATLLQNTNCRRGPGLDYEVFTYLPQGTALSIGFGIFIVLVSVYGWLTLFGVHEISWIFATPVLALCWVIGKLATTLQYR